VCVYFGAEFAYCSVPALIYWPITYNNYNYQLANYSPSNQILQDSTSHRPPLSLSLSLLSLDAGSWTYQSESDKLLVQAVSVQVRGLVLQKLGGETSQVSLL